MKEKIQRNQFIKSIGGITLIALVITIVVLLILAGITAATLTGDNGLLTKVGDVKQKNREAEIREKIQLAVASARTNDSGELKKEPIEEELTKEFGENNYEFLIVGKEYIIIVDNVQYKVEKNGAVQEGNQISINNIPNAGDLSKGGQYDGTTEETAYRVACVEDLVEWSKNYNNYKNKCIKLEKTIDFQNTSDYNNYKKITTDINGNGVIESLITELTTGKGFNPISNFSGMFDGQNNEIRNIYENTYKNAGLFACASGADIKNMTITGEITSSVAGNCPAIGGISGVGIGKAYNCKNYCKITGTKAASIGGITGWANSAQIIGCTNNGILNSNYDGSNVNPNYNAGGIVGIAFGAGNLYITNCINNADVFAHGNSGGLLGYSYAPTVGQVRNIFICNSHNNGFIKSDSVAGGLIGNSSAASHDLTKGYIYNCFVTGNVMANYKGGIYGRWPSRIQLALEKIYLLNENYSSSNAYEKTYLQSQEFVNTLNSYVDTYNEEHENDENFISLERWKYNQGNYPTFE